MMIHLPEVLVPAEVAEIVAALRAQPDAPHGWIDGAASAGALAARVKHNRQLAPECPAFAALSNRIAAALLRHPLFQAAALPSRVLPPMFNRYDAGSHSHYGDHIDNASQIDRSDRARVRTDISVTVFLSDPDDYDGGDLVVEDHYGAHDVKLPAGDAVLYDATSVHRVEPVTRGTRLASFLWVKSLVRDPQQRRMLFDLDMALVRLRANDMVALEHAATELTALVGHYHNLLRLWSE